MDPYGAFLWYQGFDEKPSTIIPLVKTLRLISVDTVHLGSALMCAAMGVGSGIGPDSI